MKKLVGLLQGFHLFLEGITQFVAFLLKKIATQLTQMEIGTFPIGQSYTESIQSDALFAVSEAAR